MENRFSALTITTIVFELICAVAVLIGLVAMITQPTANDPLAQVGSGLRVAFGFIIFFYALALLVFSGGIHVLIAMDKNTQALAGALEKLVAKFPAPTAVAMTQAPADDGAHPTHDAAMIVAAVSRTNPEGIARAVNECPGCRASNDADSRFCYECGTALAQA